MRIAVDGRPLHHPFVGIGVYTAEILRRIADEHELFIYLDRALPSRPGYRAEFRAGSGRRFRGFLTANVAFARWAERDRVDVFWSPRHHLPLALAGIPCVVTIHDLVWRVAPETMKPLNRILDATLMPVALARADRVIAVSRDTACRIRNFSGRNDVDTLPLAAREAPIRVPFAHPKPYFLFVGTKEPRKNLTGTVEGFRRAVQGGLTGHDLVLVGGDGWLQPRLRTTIANSGIEGRIIDLGPISEARLAGVYESCSGLVLASFYEGFGIPLVEAMQHGKALITSRIGAMAEVAGDAALFVDPESPASIARAFLRLGHDAATRCRLEAAARRRSRTFSWDRTARGTLHVLAAAARGDQHAGT